MNILEHLNNLDFPADWALGLLEIIVTIVVGVLATFFGVKGKRQHVKGDGTNLSIRNFASDQSESGVSFGAGGRGGSAIGSRSTAGKGGDGGAVHIGVEHPHEPRAAFPDLAKSISGVGIKPDHNGKFPGEGGNGASQTEPNQRAGDGGDGGETAFGTLNVGKGLLNVKVGEGGKAVSLPGAKGCSGGESKVYKIDEQTGEEQVHVAARGGQGGFPGASFLPSDCDEIDQKDISRGFACEAIVPANAVEIRTGLGSVLGGWWTYFYVKSFPCHALWNVLVITWLPREISNKGFFLSCTDPAGHEVSRLAIQLPSTQDKIRWIISKQIGAVLSCEGEWKFKIQASGNTLMEYPFIVERRK